MLFLDGYCWVFGWPLSCCCLGYRCRKEKRKGQLHCRGNTDEKMNKVEGEGVRERGLMGIHKLTSQNTIHQQHTSRLLFLPILISIPVPIPVSISILPHPIPPRKFNPLTISIRELVFQSSPWGYTWAAPHEWVGPEDGVDVASGAEVVREFDLWRECQ